MSYGTPVPNPDSRSYEVGIQHATLPGGITFTLDSLINTEAQSDQIVQDFLDMVAASATFTIGGAVKLNVTSQEIEATP